MKNTQETKQSKSLEDTTNGGKEVARNPDGTFAIGHEKIGGVELGFKGFKVLMDETVKEIAKINNISEAEVWRVLTRRAYSEAKNGNYNFYKDTCDRYYGKAHDVFEGDPDKPLIIQISKEIAEKYNVPN